MSKVRALVHAWLVLDFFGDARRTGGHGSTLTTTIFTQSFLALVFAALLYPEKPPVAFAAANLCLSSLLVALGMLGDEQQQQRRLADQTLLRTAPVARVQLVCARALHAAFHIGLVTVGMALPPAVLLAWLTREPLQAPAYVLAAVVAAGLTAGLLGALQDLGRRWLGGTRTALLTGTGKALALGIGVVLFARALPALEKGAEALPIGRLGAELLPPYHLARLLQAPAAESWRLLVLAGIAALAFLLDLAAGDDEPAAGERVRRGGPLSWLDDRLAGTGPRRGLCGFVSAMLWRSPGFRARVLPLFGLPAAMVFLTLGDQGRGQFLFLCTALQFPAIYLPFLIAFLPRADQPETAWVFDSAPALPPSIVRGATWRALVTHVLLPVHALAFALLLLARVPVLTAVPMSIYALATATLAARPMLEQLPVVPFTAAADDSKGLDLGRLSVTAGAMSLLGAAFGWFQGPFVHWTLAGLTALAAGASLRRLP